MSGSGRKGEVRGADRLARRLQWVRGEARERASAAVAETAEEVAGEARGRLGRAPGNLPHLAETVDTEGSDAERAVVVRHPAAPFVEFGTRSLPPRPFLQPAADGARKTFVRRMKSMLTRLVRRRM